MLNRENIILGLQSMWECLSPVNHTCGECPYQENKVGCKRRLIRDTLTLLEEKEPIEATEKQKEFAVKFGIAVPQYWCSECHYMITFLTRFCPNCGKKVKWELPKGEDDA